MIYILHCILQPFEEFDFVFKRYFLKTTKLNSIFVCSFHVNLKKYGEKVVRKVFDEVFVQSFIIYMVVGNCLVIEL